MKIRIEKNRPLYPLLLFLGAAVLFALDGRGIGLWQVSPGKSLSRLLGIVFIIAFLYDLLGRFIRVFIRKRRGPEGETTMLVNFARVIAMMTVMVALVESLGKITLFGALGAGFIGMLLGWSLQAPVSGVAAWVMVTMRRPFRIGDRVSFPSSGLIGDVIDINPMHTVLNQVGGSVSSEEASGRHILIPNAMLFSQVVINYTSLQEAPYFLVEEIARITFDSDWETAEQILLAAAREVTGEIIARTGVAPYIRADMYDYGIYMRLRYMTAAADRARISYQINRIVHRSFQASDRVDFAIPYIYSYRRGEKEKEHCRRGEYNAGRPAGPVPPAGRPAVEEES